jgi:YesN/AraC family two-component response regulator
MEFVERQRIDRARQLLTMTSLSVKEISRQVGYETQFYFSLRFKKSTGQSPKAFRELAISR